MRGINSALKNKQLSAFLFHCVLDNIEWWSSKSGWSRQSILQVGCNCPAWQSSGCPSRLCSQDSVLGTRSVVPKALVSLLQRGAMATVTALMGVTNPHPVVGGPEGTSLINDWRHFSPNFVAFFFFNLMMVHISPSSGKTCSIDNGSCSHLCADEARGARCACPVGYELSTNGTNCHGVCAKKKSTFDNLSPSVYECSFLIWEQ